MNIPRPVLVREGILDSERVCRLGLAQQLFFRNLLHVCDGAERFDADADDLRFTLYRRSLDRVKAGHVRQWLQELHAAGLIELYTRSGKAYGRVLNYGQRDTKRKVLHPSPDDEPELPLAPPDPPAAPSRPKRPRRVADAPPAADMNRSEMKGRGARREAPPPPPPESFEVWIERLRAAWPGVDILGEYAKACRRKGAAQVDRPWFENAWLPECSPAGDAEAFASLRRERRAEPAPDVAEIEGWRALLVGTNYGAGGPFEVTSWAQVARDKDLLAFVRAQAERRAAA